MAEAFLKRYASDQFQVFSAGLKAEGINPYTVIVMEELGYGLEGQTSKSIDLYLGKPQFDIIITVCAEAEKQCPFFPGKSTRLHWGFEDPASFLGSDQETLEKFREVRDKIHIRINDWLHELTNPDAV
jgi:arsenate reductase